MAKKSEAAEQSEQPEVKADSQAAPVPASTPAPAQSSQLLSVEELAEKHGQTVPAISEDSIYSRVHAGADVAHGWTRYKALKSASVKLSDADYLAALEAFKAGKLHAPANMRPQLSFTKEQKAANLAAAKAAPKPVKQAKSYHGAGHAFAMEKAKALAKSAGAALKGGK